MIIKLFFEFTLGMATNNRTNVGQKKKPASSMLAGLNGFLNFSKRFTSAGQSVNDLLEIIFLSVFHSRSSYESCVINILIDELGGAIHHRNLTTTRVIARRWS